MRKADERSKIDEMRTILAFSIGFAYQGAGVDWF